MKNSGRNSRNFSKRVALSGVLCALSLVILLSGSLIPVATFMAPILAGLCLVPVAVEFGPKTALLAYAAVSVLGLLLVPDRELVLFFVLLLGYYPLLRPTLQKLRHAPARVAVKLLLFNASVAVVYGILLFLFTSAPLREELAGRSPLFWVALLLVGNLTFLLYDNLVDKVRVIYIHRFQKRR